MQVCPFCQTQHEDTTKFCSHCGAFLPGAGQGSPQGQPHQTVFLPPDPHLLARRRRRRLLWLSLGAVGGGVAAALLLLVWFGQGSLLIKANQEAQFSLWQGGRQVAQGSGSQWATPTLSLGTYELRVHREGFKPLRQELRIGFGGRDTEVQVELTPAYGTLRVNSDPPGARVVVRNQYQTKEGTTPGEIPGVQAVPTSVEVSLPGYTPFRRTYPVTADQVNDLGTISFQGELWVDSLPGGAEVFLDDASQGVTPVRLQGLRAKTYRLKVWKKGVGLYLGEVTLEPGRTINLGALPLSQTGVLRLDSLPSQARVWLNTEDLGLTPLSRQVKAGEHRLKVEALGYATTEKTIKVPAGDFVDVGIIKLAKAAPAPPPGLVFQPPVVPPAPEPVPPSPPEPGGDPELAAARLFNEGRSLFKQNRYSEALEKFQEGLRLQPNHVYGHYMAGYTLNQLRRYDEALASFRRALALNPRHALSYEGLGWTLNQVGRHQEAIAACHQALKINPRFPEPHFNLGMAYLALGDKDQAWLHYQRLVEMKSPKAELLLSNLRKAPGGGAPPPPRPTPGAPQGSGEFQVIQDYFRLVQDKNVPGAISLYAAAKRPVIKRKLLEDVARATEYYRIQQMIPLERSDDRAVVKIYLFHKKYNLPEEYWEVTTTLVWEDGGWKVWATPGKRLR